MPKIQFRNRNGQLLVGNLELPAGGDWQATALFAHCFTCTRNIKAARNITRALARAGFAVFRFDFTGLGESEGDFADTSFSSNLDDLEDAARWLEQELAAPQLLVGHSLGGTAILAVTERLASVRAVATIGSPAHPEHVLKQFDDHVETIEQQGSAEVQLAGRPFRIRKDFIEDARSHPMSERMRKLRRALLILHSPVDNIVSIDNAQAIYEAALHPKSFISLDDADHLLSNDSDSNYVGDVLSSWAHRFLHLEARAAVDSARIRGRTDDQFLCSMQLGSHTLIADEPESMGGRNLGPDPYQQLAGSLGACTVMTLNMYARHKGLAVDRVSCDVSHQRMHAKDCADCDSDTGYISELSRSITIEGELDEAERQRMLEIADRCPVHPFFAEPGHEQPSSSAAQHGAPLHAGAAEL
ncbi:MAG: bifunctional alpha/beta hydrolase/OsmC family protein, partial [Pseudomonadota bacterium]